MSTTIKRALFVSVLMALGWSGLSEAKELTPREIYRHYGKAVVLVFGTDGSAQGSAGTGSIISKDGQIITNAHVVAKKGRPFKKVYVYLKPDKLRGSMKYDLKHRFKATVVDMDEKLDLALLRMVDAPATLRTIDFVNPDDVEIGEPVVAIGHPETGGLWTLTTGSVSSVVADFQGIQGKDVFQTEASVNRGNSGGPLLNAFGQMVGINTCISRRAADGLAITDINFSLKSSVAVDWLKRRRLMSLAYAKPGASNVPGTALASAGQKRDRAEERVPPKAPSKRAKTTRETDGSGKETIKVDGGDGKTLVAVVEPEAGEEVADDPEFQAAAGDTDMVSRGFKTRKNRAKRPKRVKPKHLTKVRPYKLDPFVSARIREIRALEDMMDDMSRKIDRRRGRTGRKTTRGNGMGLW